MYIGSTFCKGLNRGSGTFLAGILAFIIEYISDISGHIFQAVFISIAVALIGKLGFRSKHYVIFSDQRY